MNINVKLDDGAIMPTKAHKSDAGFDLYTPKHFTLGCNETIDTGVHMMIPEGYVGLILPKSGLYTKHEIKAFGVVDAGYTGSIKVHMENLSNKWYTFEKCDKITQIVIVPIPEVELSLVDEVTETERGENGIRFFRQVERVIIW